MTAIVLKNIAKFFPALADKPVLNQINLTIESGELVVFIGSSGCGKSTLLRIISGLDTPSSGEIWFEQDLMNSITPADRQVGMVFQSYALYPHMTVRENLSFGLKQKKIAKDKIEQSINSVARSLEIDHLLDHKPNALSGGQKQRVAIGRCIVQRPRVFLFDEPMSNLDSALRVKTRLEIKKLHNQLDTTMIYVTHDQVEAMTLADKIAVFAPITANNQSNLQQYGRPLELYNNPVNRFVATFLGTPKINLLAASIMSIAAQFVEVELSSGEKVQLSTNNFVYSELLKPGLQIELGIRPEHLSLTPLASVDPDDAAQPLVNTINATLEAAELLGSETLFYLKTSSGLLTLKLAQQVDEHAYQESEFVIYFLTKHVLIFDQATGQRL